MRKPTAGSDAGTDAVQPVTAATDATDATVETPVTPEATAAIDHPNPAEGGCYVRLPDGSLQREDA